MDIREDSAGQPYIEMDLLDSGEKLRVTRVDTEGEPSIVRIQVKTATGRLRQGPAIAVSLIPNLSTVLGKLSGQPING